ncbi:MAG TPA: ATP-binding protein [Gemmatimonadales bacterium]|nr:ATP-binding protein [Gemmatimonadales bacterium]
MTFSRRLASGTLIVLLLAIGTLLYRAERSLRRNLEADVAATLERDARLVRESLPADRVQWQGTVRRYSLQTGFRITLIDAQGNVVADSDFPDGPLPAIENHASRTEVRAALEGQTGQARRHSATVGRDLMYVAVPGGPGAVRVAEDLERVNGIVHRTQLSVGGAALLALLVGVALALVAARSVSRPLTGLAAAARSIAAGTPPRFPRSGVSEIDALVRSLREMHHQLDDRFEAIRNEKAESAAVVEAMSEGVIAADDRGRITTANPSARRLLGYAADAPLPELPQIFRSREARELVDTVLAGDADASRTLDLDGRTLLITGRALPSGGAVLVMHDLTELRRLESVRRDFVANVSHELKTPLTSISGYSETLLSDRPDPETVHLFLTRIATNARRMQHLVDDLLDLSRIEAGRWQPAVRPVDPAELAREVWTGLQDRNGRPIPRFEVRVPGGLRVQADADALRQVLTNLLDNALRYTDADGLITVSARAESGGVRLDVSDTGTGIPRDHLPRIFERFYRADPSRSREEGGTGLGLSIVRHLVEGHGGRVSADSVLGQGTTISCWFPDSSPA